MISPKRIHPIVGNAKVVSCFMNLPRGLKRGLLRYRCESGLNLFLISLGRFALKEGVSTGEYKGERLDTDVPRGRSGQSQAGEADAGYVLRFRSLLVRQE